ncbi:MAG: universal stress protein [Archangium sp.]|nr:universal stress protein [Archangium sp.]
MKKILAAVDGSTASLHAAEKALELAQGLRAELTLVHVASPIIMPTEVPLPPVIDLREAALAEGAAVLRATERALEGATVKTLNLFGPPAETIADAARGFDLVVVGNKGRGAVSRVLLGSVADRLVHICRCPVLVVR